MEECEKVSPNAQDSSIKRVMNILRQSKEIYYYEVDKLIDEKIRKLELTTRQKVLVPLVIIFAPMILTAIPLIVITKLKFTDPLVFITLPFEFAASTMIYTIYRVGRYIWQRRKIKLIDNERKARKIGKEGKFTGVFPSTQSIWRTRFRELECEFPKDNSVDGYFNSLLREIKQAKNAQDYMEKVDNLLEEYHRKTQPGLGLLEEASEDQKNERSRLLEPTSVDKPVSNLMLDLIYRMILSPQSHNSHSHQYHGTRGQLLILRAQYHRNLVDKEINNKLQALNWSATKGWLVGLATMVSFGVGGSITGLGVDIEDFWEYDVPFFGGIGLLGGLISYGCFRFYRHLWKQRKILHFENERRARKEGDELPFMSMLPVPDNQQTLRTRFLRRIGISTREQKCYFPFDKSVNGYFVLQLQKIDKNESETNEGTISREPEFSKDLPRIWTNESHVTFSKEKKHKSLKNYPLLDLQFLYALVDYKINDNKLKSYLSNRQTWVGATVTSLVVGIVVASPIPILILISGPPYSDYDDGVWGMAAIIGYFGCIAGNICYGSYRLIRHLWEYNKNLKLEDERAARKHGVPKPFTAVIKNTQKSWWGRLKGWFKNIPTANRQRCVPRNKCVDSFFDNENEKYSSDEMEGSSDESVEGSSYEMSLLPMGYVEDNAQNYSTLIQVDDDISEASRRSLPGQWDLEEVTSSSDEAVENGSSSSDVSMQSFRHRYQDNQKAVKSLPTYSIFSSRQTDEQLLQKSEPSVQSGDSPLDDYENSNI